MADREKDLALLEMEAARKRVRAWVRQEFISLLAAQERIALSRDLVHLAGAAHGLAVKKVRAGKASPTDSLQAFMALSLARIDSGKAADDLILARQSLASACGLPKPPFDSAAGRLGPVTSISDWETLAGRLTASPEWKRSDLGGKVRDAEVRAEKTARFPGALPFGGASKLQSYPSFSIDKRKNLLQKGKVPIILSMPRSLKSSFSCALVLILGFFLLLAPLAQAGVALCVGLDGHIAVENLGADCCALPPGEATVAFPRQVEEACDTCLDIPLPQHDLASIGQAPLQAVGAVFPPPSLLEILPPSWLEPAVQPPPASFDTPALAAKRTVVLLV